jgi:sigma-E factor negative regulatory protein RseA
LFEQAASKLSARWSMAASFAAVMVVSYMALQTMGDTQHDVTLVAEQPSETLNVAKVGTVEIGSLPLEYLMVHQASSPSASSYYMQTTSYSE